MPWDRTKIDKHTRALYLLEDAYHSYERARKRTSKSIRKNRAAEVIRFDVRPPRVGPTPSAN